jgi:hypothetical protein
VFTGPGRSVPTVLHIPVGKGKGVPLPGIQSLYSYGNAIVVGCASRVIIKDAFTFSLGHSQMIFDRKTPHEKCVN